MFLLPIAHGGKKLQKVDEEKTPLEPKIQRNPMRRNELHMFKCAKCEKLYDTFAKLKGDAKKSFQFFCFYSQR